MDYRSVLIQFALGCCGGMIAETLHWHRVAKRGVWPKYARSVMYWVLTLMLVASGGVVAAAVSGPGTSPLQLLLLGIVGPQLLTATAQAQSLKHRDQEVYLGTGGPTVREFLAA